MAVDTLPNVGLTCDPRPFKAAIIATAIPAAMRIAGMLQICQNDAKRNLDLNT